MFVKTLETLLSVCCLHKPTFQINDDFWRMHYWCMHAWMPQNWMHGSKVEFHFKKDSKSFVFGKKAMLYNISQPSGEL